MFPSSQPRRAQHASTHLLQSAGVAIFHLRSSRVVVCHHSREKYWFLPKGRRDVGEGIEAAGEREGFEESGYLNRLLPLPLPHLQTYPSHAAVGSDESEQGDAHANVTEPVWVQLMPYNRVVQYILYWFIAETVPPAVEQELSKAMGLEQLQSGQRPTQYCRAPPFPSGTTLRERIAQEGEDFEPRRHPGTGLEEDEKNYESFLLGIDEAMDKLKGTLEQDVVRIGWEAIRTRLQIEASDI